MSDITYQDMTEVMGLGSYVGELRAGPDGGLYQWTHGVDGLGNPLGFWKKLRAGVKKVQRFTKKAIPIAEKIAPFVPVYGPAISAGLTAAKPLLRATGFAGLSALYEAPDGTFYQQVGGIGATELGEHLGIGAFVGEVRVGPDGAAYQWDQAVDGLGNSFGFWKKLRKRLKPWVKKGLKVARTAAPLLPGPYGQKLTSVLDTATPILKQVGVAGTDGMGALYEGPDGDLYQVDGLEDGDADDEAAEGVEGLDCYMRAAGGQTDWCGPSAVLPDTLRPLF